MRLHPPQTAAEARGLVLSTMVLLRAGELSQERMTELAPLARHAIKVRGIAPWEREFLEAMADLFEADDPASIAAAEAKFAASLKGIEPT